MQHQYTTSVIYYILEPYEKRHNAESRAYSFTLDLIISLNWKKPCNRVTSTNVWICDKVREFFDESIRYKWDKCDLIYVIGIIVHVTSFRHTFIPAFIIPTHHQYLRFLTDSACNYIFIKKYFNILIYFYQILSYWIKKQFFS